MHLNTTLSNNPTTIKLDSALIWEAGMVWAHLGPWVQFVTNLIKQLSMRNNMPTSSLAPMLHDALGCVLEATLTQALCLQIQPPSIQRHEITWDPYWPTQCWNKLSSKSAWSEVGLRVAAWHMNQSTIKGGQKGSVLCLMCTCSLSWHFTEKAPTRTKSQKLFVMGTKRGVFVCNLCVCACACFFRSLLSRNQLKMAGRDCIFSTCNAKM